MVLVVFRWLSTKKGLLLILALYRQASWGKNKLFNPGRSCICSLMSQVE